MRTARVSALAVTAALFCSAVLAQTPMRDDLTGRLRVVSMSKERLADLAAQNGLGTLQVLAANQGLELFDPQTRDRVVLPTAHLLPDGPRDGIVINRADYRLYYFSGGQLVLTAPVGLGQSTHETPIGATTVVRKVENPTWYPTDSTRDDFPDLPAVVDPGPENPLGTRALYLGWPSYLIHGAVDSYAIGRRFTRGCIRLRAQDIERLFDLVPVGTPVTIVDQPLKLGWHKGEFFLEAHPDFDQIEELRVKSAFAPRSAAYFLPYISAKAGDRSGDVDWIAVASALAARRGVPVQITSPVTRPVDIIDHGAGS